MIKVKGSDMCRRLQEEVLSRFVHRYTKDHTPLWANGTRYPVQFASDQDWMEHTFFWVRITGELSEKHRYCESHPTWPDGKEPYV